MPNPLQSIKAWFSACFPVKQEPAAPIRRADYFNSRLRVNLGMEERRPSEPAVHGVPYSSHEPSAPEARPSAEPPSPSPSQRSRKSSNTPLVFTTTSMKLPEFTELFNVLHEAFGHVPYAIIGTGALLNHGLSRRKASKISVVCPQECKDTIRTWAAARGYRSEGASIGIPLSTGSIRQVRIKYLETGFERLELVRSSFSNATVLSVSSQLDSVAAAYLDQRRRGDEGALATIAGDVFHILDRVAARRTRLDPARLPTFLGEDFFSAFTERHLEARPEMARAGLDVAAVLARHRAATALREHDAMLRQYGARGDVPESDRGQFEGMRDLRHSKSVYTLRERDSQILPAVPEPALQRPGPGPGPAPLRVPRKSALASTSTLALAPAPQKESSVRLARAAGPNTSVEKPGPGWI